MFKRLFQHESLRHPTPAESVVDDAVRDPAALYGVPANVLNDMRLSRTDKLRILESWAHDQKRLMESEDENMPQVQGGRPSAAALYQDIMEACRKLAH